MTDSDAMLAKHSAQGQLQSGNTLIQAAKAWETRTTDAIELALAEFAGLIETRRGEWKRAMRAIMSGISEHRQAAPSSFEKIISVAAPRGGRGGSAEQAFLRLLDEAADRNAKRVTAFSEGWTSPKPRKWNERHPVAYALALAVVGAVFALGVRAAGDATKPTASLPVNCAFPAVRNR